MKISFKTKPAKKQHTWEICPSCGNTICVPIKRKSTCPKCGCKVRPCSICSDLDCNTCPYGDKKHDDKAEKEQ